MIRFIKAWFHTHRDPTWQLVDGREYHICDCGARRVIEGGRGVGVPVPRGFPRLVDIHGRGLRDSGWKLWTKYGTKDYPKSVIRKTPPPPGPYII
jgi:hypothetical protein